MAVLLLRALRLDAVLFGAVSDESLKLADGDRLGTGLCISSDALALALGLLRTHAAADCRKRGGLGDDLVSAGEISLRQFGNESRNIDVDRASFHAARLLAV